MRFQSSNTVKYYALISFSKKCSLTWKSTYFIKMLSEREYTELGVPFDPIRYKMHIFLCLDE